VLKKILKREGERHKLPDMGKQWGWEASWPKLRRLGALINSNTRSGGATLGKGTKRPPEHGSIFGKRWWEQRGRRSLFSEEGESGGDPSEGVGGGERLRPVVGLSCWACVGGAVSPGGKPERTIVLKKFKELTEVGLRG